MHMDGHGGIRKELQRNCVRSGGEYTTRAKPAGGFDRDAGAMRLRDVALCVLVIAPPSGTDQHDVTLLDDYLLIAQCGFEVSGGDGEVFRERLDVLLGGNIEQYAAAKNGPYRIYRLVVYATAIGLDGFDICATVEFPAAGKMVQRVDVSADVSTERDGIGGGAHAGWA